MKTLPKHLFLGLLVMCFAITSAFAKEQTKEKKDYLIVVSNSTDKAANEKVLADVKGDYEDAGLYYDSSTKQYYVYIERYYVKSGADYAVYWLKKNRPGLPKIWAKAVPPGAK